MEYLVKKEDFSIVFKNDQSNEYDAKSNEYDAKSNELLTRITEFEDKELSEKDKERLFVIVEMLLDKGSFNGVAVAEILKISEQMARKLLRKAEKFGFIQSEGKTKDKKYFF